MTTLDLETNEDEDETVEQMHIVLQKIILKRIEELKSDGASLRDYQHSPQEMLVACEQLLGRMQELPQHPIPQSQRRTLH
jgi:hypothetical protein